MKHFPALSAAVLAAFIFSSVSAQQTSTILLSGTGSDDAIVWDFKCDKGMNSGKWGKIAVPSQWEIQGYGEYTYGRFYTQNMPCSDEQGIYRRNFKVPAAWKGMAVDIVFDGVMTDAEVLINGKPAGPVHQGAFYRFSYRISKLLRYGGTNSIEVRVKKESDNRSVNNAERRADWWLFGGIYRPVWLKAQPSSHIEYAAIDARADGSMSIDLELENAPQGAQIKYELSSAAEPDKLLQSQTLDAAEAHQELRWEGVRPWDCEHPNMYVLTMSLIRDGKVLHMTEQRIGFRTVEFRPQDGIYVNGTRLVLKGVNRHCFHPESGRTTSRAIDLEDAMLIKQMNANAIRSHYPPDARFLNMCDSLGLFYLDELAGWHGRYDDEVGPGLVREMIRRDVNHPCVIIWDNGNEGGWNTHLDSLFYAFDPQKRHVIHPWADFDDLDTHHYPAYLTGVGRFTNGYKVFMPTEFMHTNYDEGAGAGLEDFWNSWVVHPLFAGGFIWAWVDESVVRSDKGGILDSFMNMGNDGIVGPYREKEGSWWTVRDIWSPIQFDKLYITDSFAGDFLITNKYLFSTLKDCRMDWKVKSIYTPKEGARSETIAQGAMEVPALERDCKGRLHMDLPDNFFEGDVLEIEGFGPDGSSICTWTWPIHYTAQYCEKHGVGKWEPAHKGISTIESAADLIRVTNGGSMVVFHNKTGVPIAISNNGRHTHLENFRPVGMKWKFIGGKVRQDGNDVVYCAKYLGGVDSVVWRLKADGTLAMDAVVLNRDRGGKGFDDAFMDPDVKFLGFTFDFPEDSIKSMTWLGRGPYRVWKNRQRGHNIDLWYKDWNNTITAETDVPHGHLQYPEFKGYHANIYWAKLESDFNPLAIYSATDGLYLRVFTPEQPHHIEKGSSNPEFPEGDLSLLFDINAIKSFKPIPHQGPHSQPGNVRIKSGDEGLHLSVLFDFSESGAQGSMAAAGTGASAAGTAAVSAHRPTDANGVWDTTLDSLVKAQSARPVPGSSRKGESPVLFLIGDSTMRTGTLGNGDNGQWGWGFFAHEYFDESRIRVENHALGGMSSRTFYTRLWPAVLEGIRPGDYVIFQLGHNDNGPYDEGRARASIPGTGTDSLVVTIKESGEKETVYSYGEYLRRFIREAEGKGAHCLLFTLTPRNSRETDGSITRKSSTFDPWLKEVSSQTGVPLIDLEGITASRFETYSPWKVGYMFYRDKIHTSAFGAKENARSAAEGIMECTESDLRSYLLPLEKPVEDVQREPGKPVLFLTGDSTMKNNDNDPDGMWGWGSVASTVFDESKITVHNAGKAGRSARTFLTEGRWEKVYNSIRPGDFVVIQFGHNDAGSITDGRARGDIHGTADTSAVFKMKATGRNEVVYSYGWYLRKFVDDVREKGGTPLILSVTPRNEWPDGKMERRNGDLQSWAREVASSVGCDFVDITEISASFYDGIGREAAASYFKNDHTHTSRLGAEQNARAFADGLKMTGHPLAESVCAFAQGTDWYTPVQENKPYVRWWWLGSAVDKEGLTYNLEEFASKGIGGVEVTPIYGVMGNEANDIDYLSPKWMEMYGFLLEEGKRTGVQIDMNCGTGWPFGGPQIYDELAAHKMKIENGHLECVQTRQQVKRAAPGGEGWVMDHYNPEAIKTYLERFDKAFEESGLPHPDTWFNDSYEVYGADWTEKFPEIFKEKYGYDIVPYLIAGAAAGNGKTSVATVKADAGTGSSDYERAVCDYRECLAGMLMENFTQPWIQWAHSHGARIRNQAHGSPANIIDLYAAVDIPECETFGGSEFDIPGLRKDSIRRHNDGDPAALRFATSAAHLTGKKYCSAEALTWMTDHFRTSLSQCKPELDLAFASGVNHIYFHGAPYSPKGVKWPGWMFYAAINMSPTSSMWGDAEGLFKYIERCQAFLSAGKPDADFLIYFPIYDAWSSHADRPYMMFAIHGLDRVIPGFMKTVTTLTERGFDVDYISDDLLSKLDIDKPVIVPDCKYMPLETARRLSELQKAGVKIYFTDGKPQDVPGLKDLDNRRKEFKRIARSFKAVSLDQALKEYTPETFKSHHGITMLRRSNECGGFNYFVSMLQNKTQDGWVRLARPAVSAMIYDPLGGESGKAEVRTTADGCTEVRLQLAPGESRFIKTFPYEISSIGWKYIGSFGEAIPIDKAWSVRFEKSDPEIKGFFFTDKPRDWTTLKPEELKHNFGIGHYSTAIPMTDVNAADEWILDLGEVRESARVAINGEEVGCLWCAPFRIPIGKYLKPGINLLDVWVTNLPTNRIAQMDRDGVKWRIFKNANISPLPQYNGEQDYTKRPVDHSGLCSEVKLIPVRYSLPDKEDILSQTRLVNDFFTRKYQDPTGVMPFPSRHKVYECNIWTRAVYYEGLLALYGIDPQQKYLDYTRAWGDYCHWNMRNGQTLTRNADNYCCSQAYIEMSQYFNDPSMMENVVKCMENILNSQEAESDWTWIDAIQMGMPSVVAMGVLTGNKAYFEKAWSMYNWTRSRFFNSEDGLWWRDKDFCPPYKTPGGKNCYWSRGNGWVIAALTRVLKILPNDDPHRNVYISDFKAMAAALAACQRTDGTWNCSLADPEDFGGPEATGTSLFLYGLAWGVNSGLLDRNTYLEVVSKGWNGLNRICIHDNGFIGYSQGSGKEPKEAQPLSYDRIPDFEDFGTGCFLLAGSEVYKLAK